MSEEIKDTETIDRYIKPISMPLSFEEVPGNKPAPYDAVLESFIENRKQSGLELAKTLKEISGVNLELLGPSLDDN